MRYYISCPGSVNGLNFTMGLFNQKMRKNTDFLYATADSDYMYMYWRFIRDFPQ